MRKSSLLTPLLAAGTLMIPTAAWAQAAEGEAAPAPAAEPAAEAPAPAAEAPPPAAEAAPPMETAQVDETAPEAAPPPPPPAMEPSEMEAPAAAPVVEAPAEEEGGGVPGWFRFDSDGLGLQLWAGASHDVGGVSIASDIYVDSHTFGEFDIGVEIPIGDNVLLIPMAGIGFDWAQMKPVSLIAPQLFAYLDFDPIYIEWWSQFFINSIFAEPGYEPVDDGMGGTTFVEASEGVGNTWYNRLFVLFNATENFSIGPQIEPNIALNDAAKRGDSALANLPVGGRVNLGYGENNTAGLFLGYETVSDARIEHTELDEMGGDAGNHEHGIVGRFTFVRTW